MGISIGVAYLYVLIFLLSSIDNLNTNVNHFPIVHIAQWIRIKQSHGSVSVLQFFSLRADRDAEYGINRM
jgi:hypothetical protein